MRQGDIVLINFPFSDRRSGKPRPALVVSNNAYNDRDDDRLFVLISSRMRLRSSADLPIRPDDPDFPLSGLEFPSVLRCNKVVYLDSTKLRARRLGRLSHGWLIRIADTISEVVHPATSQPDSTK